MSRLKAIRAAAGAAALLITGCLMLVFMLAGPPKVHPHGDPSAATAAPGGAAVVASGELQYRADPAGR